MSPVFRFPLARPLPRAVFRCQENRLPPDFSGPFARARVFRTEHEETRPPLPNRPRKRKSSRAGFSRTQNDSGDSNLEKNTDSIAKRGALVSRRPAVDGVNRFLNTPQPRRLSHRHRVGRYTASTRVESTGRSKTHTYAIVLGHVPGGGRPQNSPKLRPKKLTFYFHDMLYIFSARKVTRDIDERNMLRLSND